MAKTIIDFLLRPLFRYPRTLIFCSLLLWLPGVFQKNAFFVVWRVTYTAQNYFASFFILSSVFYLFRIGYEKITRFFINKSGYLQKNYTFTTNLIKNNVTIDDTHEKSKKRDGCGVRPGGA